MGETNVSTFYADNHDLDPALSQFSQSLTDTSTAVLQL